MERVLFVDGMNLAWKAIHAYDLSTSYGEDTSAVFGFFNQLANVINCRNIRTIVVWDSGYPERTELSQKGIERGIIKVAYKSGRKKIPKTPKILTMNTQIPAIKEGLDLTDVKQVIVENQEADDVIASYCERLKTLTSVLCFTSDHDYYQLLHDNVSIISRFRGEESLITAQTFSEEKGISPLQWVDVGALAGDASDSIIGVPGCGDSTALKYVKRHGSAESLIKAMQEKFELERATYPDLQSREEIDQLIEAGKTSSGNSTFEGCYPGMPFSGVALALARKQVKKVKKIELKFAMYQERIRLAFKLKKMGLNLRLPNVIFEPKFDQDKFGKFCDKYELRAIWERSETFDFL